MNYILSTSSIETLQKRVNKLNKKGGNLVLTVSEPYDKPLKVWNDNTGRWIDTGTSILVCDVTLEGQLKYEGWTILASIDYTENGNVINCHDGQKLPEIYRTQKAICEHCNTNRNRSQTVIIKNDITETYKQIGKNCLAGYIGQDLFAYTAYLQMIDECSSLQQEENDMISEGNYSRYIRRCSLLEYLCHVYEVIRCYGYTSGAKALEYEIESTRTKVDFFMEKFLSKKQFDKREEEILKVGYNMEIAETPPQEVFDALEWIKTVDTNNSDYLYNLQTICKSEFIDLKYQGYVSSLLTAYRKATNKIILKEKKQEEQKQIEFYGNVSDKINITANVKLLCSFDGQWGATHIYNITAESLPLHVFVWKTSSYLDEGIFNIKGTIKGHNDYKGLKQTELTRCKVVKIS